MDEATGRHELKEVDENIRERRKERLEEEGDGSTVMREKYWRRNRNTEETQGGVTGGADKSLNTVLQRKRIC